MIWSKSALDGENSLKLTVKPAINSVLKVAVHYWKYHRLLNNQHLVETVGEQKLKKRRKGTHLLRYTCQ